VTGPFALTVLLGAVSSVLSTGVTQQAADTHNFSRYQIIVDRSPFGAPAAGADIPQPNFAARFSFIGMAKLSDSQPLMAIIQDKESNNRIYFKSAGDTIGGVAVVSVEKSPVAKLVLKQALETATLTLETKGSGGRPLPPSMARGQPMPPPPPSQRNEPNVSPGSRRIPFLRGG